MSLEGSRRQLPGFAAIDTITCLLMVFVVFAVLEKLVTVPPSIQTYGMYAVVVTWPAKNNDDIDTYVLDPQGNVAWFGNVNAGYMHLEHDDLGTVQSKYGGQVLNEERVVIRQVAVGEYIVNIHCYSKNSVGVVPVTIELYKLLGADKLITTTTVVISQPSQERTAFRFSLNSSGTVTGMNHLSRLLVSNAGNTMSGNHELGIP